MPRKYLRKTNYGNFNPQQMVKALNDVRDKKHSIREAAKLNGVSKDMVFRRLKIILNSGKGDAAAFSQKKLGSKSTVFTEDQERQLLDYINKMENALYGLNQKDLRRIAFDYCIKLNIQNPFNKEKKLAGMDWAMDFMKRNQLVFRKPETVSQQRYLGMTKTAIKSYFETLRKLIEENNFGPNDIYNVDETGVQNVHRPGILNNY